MFVFPLQDRFISEQETDDESVSSDIECDGDDKDSAAVESNDDDERTSVTGLMHSDDECKYYEKK